MDSNQPSLVVDRLHSVHVFDELGNPSFCVSIQEKLGRPVLSIYRITESATKSEQPELVSLELIKRHLDRPYAGVYACTTDEGQPIPLLVETVDLTRQSALLRQRNGCPIRYCDRAHVN